MTAGVNGQVFAIGDRVRVIRAGFRAEGSVGVVVDYDGSTEWYALEFDSGPPWRGRYEAGELEVLK